MKAKIVLLIASLLLCFYVYPSAFIYPQDTLPDSNDTRLLAYIVNQVQENILTNRPLYQGRFFAPQPNTLAYSDLFLTTSLLTLPLRLFTRSPLFIFNIGFILNFILTSCFAFVFFDYFFKNKYTSALTTLLFILSGYHLHYYAHLQIFSLWLFLGALLNLQRFLDNHQTKDLILFLVLVTLQLAETIFTTYLLFFASVFILLNMLRRNGLAKTARNMSMRSRRTLSGESGTREFGFWRTMSLCIFPTIWFLLLYPYVKLHLLYPEATRPIRDAAHFSLGLDEVFTLYHSWTIIIVFLISSMFSPSVSFAAIFCKVRRAWSLAKTRVYALQTRNFPRRGKLSVADKWIQIRDINSWKYLFFFSIIMSLGPVLKVFGHNLKIFNWPIPLPYTLFYYLFPGFTGFRTPSRFIVLALLAACFIIGQNLNSFFNNLKPKSKVIFLTLVFTLLAIEAHLPLTGYPVNISLPPVYNQVKQLPANAIILELPIKLWNMPDHQIESIRSLYSLEHQHSRFGGYSGFATNNWINLVEEINTYGLTPEVIQKTKGRGVTHIIENNTIQKI